MNLVVHSFPIDGGAVNKSLLVPFCSRITKAMVYLVPLELQEKFKDAYQDIEKSVDENGGKV